jgi:hypothetical protein
MSMVFYNVRESIVRKVHGLQGSRGFALVASLLLLSLLVVLVATLLSLLRIEVRTTSSQMLYSQARQNALNGMEIAIGQLQAEMGPDQRISMTADQLILAGGDGSTSSAAEGNRYWTGVYDSWSSASTDRPVPAFRSWLISGESSLTSQENAPETAITAEDSVELVGAGTVGPGSLDKRVRVPVVEFPTGSGNRNRMAWWVGDQGVKAALSTPPLASNAELSAVRHRLHSAPRSACELAALDDGTTRPFESVGPGDARLLKMTSWPQAGFLAGDPTQASPLFHDFSAYSTGLLTNVRAGGFRKDLSMKMETYTTPPDLADPENILYTVRSDLTGLDEIGINFLELWGYYQLYKELNYGSGLSYTTGESVPAEAPLLQTADSVEGIVDDHWDMFKHPLPINYKMLLSFEVYPYNDRGTTINALHVNFDPIITLWNPLDVAVSVQNFTLPVNGRNTCYMYSFSKIPYDINVSINGGPTIVCPLSNCFREDVSMDVGRVIVPADEPLVLRPGEVVMFSQAGSGGSGSRLFREYDASGFSGLRLFGKKGFNFGGGMSAVLRDNSQSVVYGVRRTGVPIELNSGDTFTYTLTPNDDRNRNISDFGHLFYVGCIIGEPYNSSVPRTHIGGVSFDHRLGYRRAHITETTRSTREMVPNPLNLLASDSQLSAVFPTFQGADTRPLTGAQLDGRKELFMSYALRTITEVDSDRGTKMLARLNPKSHFINYYDLSEDEQDTLPYELRVRSVTSPLDPELAQVLPNGQSYFGSSMAGAYGSTFVVTHSVPRQPIVSLAALQNSCANGFNRLMTSGISWGPLRTDRVPADMLARHPLLPQVSHAIGNSLAPAIMPPDQTEFNGLSSDYPQPLADHSYLANRELWDDYFFSGIAPQPAPVFSMARDQKAVALEFFRDGKPLPVARYLPDTGGRDATDLVDSFFSGAVPNMDSIARVASHLRVDGMFNVNSTSVEAWKAILGSLKNHPIVVSDEDGVESIADPDGAVTDEKTPVASISAPRDILLEDSTASSPDRNQNWDGRRVLSDDEIDQLARAIVKEVRKRGPFLSLADFINRRVGTDLALARSGAIQAALDSDDAGVNTAQINGRAVDPSDASRFEFPEAEEGAIHYGASSLVKQADILTPIAPILSARSDSFVIRAYGDATNNSGSTARAWCEAVVERSRDYLDSSDEPEILPAMLTAEVNRRFGRSFRVRSFRWLNPDEI